MYQSKKKIFIEFYFLYFYFFKFQKRYVLQHYIAKEKNTTFSSIVIERSNFNNNIQIIPVHPFEETFLGAIVKYYIQNFLIFHLIFFSF
jgi:hypothetical protein